MSERSAGLDDLVVVVTGAARGIGRQIAHTLADRGATLVLADLDEPALIDLATELRTRGRAALPIRCDVTDADDWTQLACRANEEFGRIDGGVLAAGIAEHVPFLDLTSAQWHAMIGVHLTGAFHGLQTLGRCLEHGGSLVYIASTVAESGGPPRQAHYVAAKAGALGLVRSAARELGPAGIRVNAVSPGFTETSMNDAKFSDEELAAKASRAPLGRVAVPEDVAGTVAFLMSRDSAFVTGENLRIDGGSRLG